MTELVEKIIVDIIVNELDLSDQNVWVTNQNIVIPDTDGLFINVGVVDIKTMGNIVRMDPTETGAIEHQEIVQRENVQIDLFSRDNSARNRRFEVLMALKSYYSQRQQEDYQFKISSIPTSFVMSSDAEGGSTLNRFSLIVGTLTNYSKSKTVEYYDTFSVRVDDEDTIGEEEGLIELQETA